MKRLSLVLALTVLGGCATVDSNHEPVTGIEQAQVNLSLSQLSYQPVTVDRKSIHIDQELNQDSQWTDAGGISSPVASWKLPDDGIYQFELQTFISRTLLGRASTFIPELWLLDAGYQPLKKLSADQLSYNETAILSREYLSLEFTIDNRHKDRPTVAYLAALATDASMDKDFRVVNFEAEYARARGKTPYQKGDVFAEPVTEGALRLTVTPMESFKDVSVEIPKVVPAGPVSVTAQNLSPSQENDLKQLSQNFISDIERALAEGDVQQAMQMRNEAQAMNARLHQHFTDNYGQANTSVPQPDLKAEAGFGESSLDKKLSQAFLSELDQELQKGNAQNALAILDLSSQLLRDVDAVF